MQSALSRSRLLCAATFGAALTVLAACGDSGPKKDITPATITPSTTDTLRATAGSAVNTVLTVTVKNAAGDPVDSALVTFAASAGGGAVSNPSSRTDATGKASTSWTLGNTAGVQTVTATSGTLTTTFTAIAAASTAATVAKLAGDAQTAAASANVAVAPSVKVTDKFGNGVSGVLVTFSVASGGGAVTGPLVNTDANGVATVGSWKLGPAIGPNSLTATATGLTAVTFSATASAGAATQVVFSSAAPTLNIGQTATVVAQVKDANNNVVTGAALTYSSANTNVATVGASTGVVTGVAGGTTTITATSGTLTAQLAVSVIGHAAGAVLGTVAMTSSIGGIAAAGNTAYVARSTASAVGVVDLPSATLTTSIDLAARTVDVAANSAGTLVAAATSGPNLVWFMNGSTNVRTDSIELPAAPVKLAMTSTGTKAYVDLNNFSLQVIDVPSRTITTTIPVGGTVTAMKIGAGDTLMYVATKLGALYEISIATNAIKRQFSLGLTTIVDLAVAPNGKTLYVTDGTSNVTIVRLATGGMADGIVGFGGSVSAVGVPPDGGALWAAYPGVMSIIPIINGAFDIQTTTAVAGMNASQIVFNRLGTLAAVADVSVNQLIVFK
ncbi:MAG: hypothetical protein JWM41_554 [Gemmatimonadetes bacterium]|nr:hypothetical protein [Gemmatimonadota bacterium]